MLNTPELASGCNERTIEFRAMNNEYPVIFLNRLARKTGYDLYLKVDLKMASKIVLW